MKESGTMHTARLFTRYDIVIFAAVLTLAAVLFLSGLKGQENSYVLINIDGEKTTVPLDKDNEITLKNNGVTLTVTVKDNSVCVSSSDCRDGICVGTGKIHKEGQIIVCAPAKISVCITGNAEEDYDAVTS